MADAADAESAMTDRLPRGIVPPGTYAKGGRSPIVYVRLCPPCAGYAPATGGRISS